MLLEKTNDCRFAKAIRTFKIELHASFAVPFAMPHKELVSEGIIRKQLTKALSRLPNCTAVRSLNSTSMWDDEERLCSSLLEADFLHSIGVWDPLPDGTTSSAWVSNAGFCFHSYIACDIIAALTDSSNNVQRLELDNQQTGSEIELGPLGDYLNLCHADVVSSTNMTVMNLSIIDYHCADEVLSYHSQTVLSKLDTQSNILSLLFERFPQLKVLHLAQRDSPSRNSFPAMLPTSLRILHYYERDALMAGPRAVIHGLRDLVHLESLKLVDLKFECHTECAQVLRTTGKLPSLKELWFFPEALKSPGSPSSDGCFCFQECKDEISKHTWYTKDIAKDVPLWIRSVHYCMCKEK